MKNQIRFAAKTECHQAGIDGAVVEEIKSVSITCSRCWNGWLSEDEDGSSESGEGLLLLVVFLR